MHIGMLKMLTKLASHAHDRQPCTGKAKPRQRLTQIRACAFILPSLVPPLCRQFEVTRLRHTGHNLSRIVNHSSCKHPARTSRLMPI